MNKTAVLLASLVVALGFLARPAGATVPDGSLRLAPALGLASFQDPPKDIQIDVEVGDSGGEVWYLNPVWIAIGVLALIVVLILIVLASRGGGSGAGGTTIVKS